MDTSSKATGCRYLLCNLWTLHYSGAVAPAVALHDIPKEDTGGGKKKEVGLAPNAAVCTNTGAWSGI